MKKATKEQIDELIHTLYPLVTAGGISLEELAQKLDFNSPGSLRTRAFNLGATGKKDDGKKLLKKLNKDNTTVETYMNQFFAGVPEIKPTVTSDIPMTIESRWELSDDAKDIRTALDKRIVTFPLSTHKQMKMDYSSWGGTNLTQAKMAAKYGLTKREFTKYKNIHGWTKAEDGFLDEDILERDPDELAVDIIERRAKLQKSFVEKQRERDEQDATKWRDLQAGVWDPFSLAIKSPIAYKVPKVSFKKSKKVPTRKLVINANDWQIGELAQAVELNKGEDWNTGAAKKAIANYAASIAEHIHYSGYNYDEAFICDLGDLGHGLHGYTAHGTPLEVDSTRQEQVNVIIYCLRTLIDSIRQLVPKTHVYHVEGNHLGFTSTLIFDQIGAWYGGERPTKDVEIHSNYKPVEYVSIGDTTLLVLYHGKTGGPGRGMATSGAKRERDAYHLIMEGVRRYPNNRNVNLLTGHIHHRLLEEYSDVTVHTLGTIAVGDFYADQNLLTGCPPTQTIMEIDPKTGLITSIPILVTAT